MERELYCLAHRCGSKNELSTARVVTTKTGRKMAKVQYADYGATKTRFIARNGAGHFEQRLRERAELAKGATVGALPIRGSRSESNQKVSATLGQVSPY